MKMRNENFLTVNDLCKLWGCSRLTIYRALKRGDLLSTRVGRAHRFAPDTARRGFRHRQLVQQSKEGKP